MATTRSEGCTVRKKVTGRDRACASGGRNVARQTQIAAKALKDLVDHFAGHVVMPRRVAELFELIEDHTVGPRLANFPALVVDLFHIRFAARRWNHLGADFLEPLEPLAAHFFGQNRDGRAAHQRRIERPAAAVVAGAGPNRFVLRRIELSAHQFWHETAERRPDFMSAGGKELADKADDPRIDAGERRWKLNPIAFVVQPAALDRFVLPRDAEQVDRIDVPQARRF